MSSFDGEASQLSAALGLGPEAGSKSRFGGSGQFGEKPTVAEATGLVNSQLNSTVIAMAKEAQTAQDPATWSGVPCDGRPNAVSPIQFDFRVKQTA